MQFIDIIDKECLICNMHNDELYLVGRSTGSGAMYFAKRRGSQLYFSNFSFNVDTGFATVVNNHIVVRGFRAETNLFEEVEVDFRTMGVSELLFQYVKGLRIYDSSMGFECNLVSRINMFSQGSDLA